MNMAAPKFDIEDLETVGAFLKADRAASEDQTRIAELEAQVRAQQVYIKELEGALLSAPLYNPVGHTRAEINYVNKRTAWLDKHRPLLERAAADPIRERDRCRAAAKNKVHQVKNRVETLLRRRDAGDTTAPVPQLDDLWKILEKEMALL